MSHHAGEIVRLPDVESRQVTLNGVHLEVLTAGTSGPLAVCLHGFPDTAHTWRHLAPALVDAGYRVAAPFLRGYAPSSVPEDERFEIAASCLDAIGLHELLGEDRPGVVIGHDWGAVAAHGAAVAEPERWAAVVTAAVPPGSALAQSLLDDVEQLARSWYFFVFQHPLADLVVPAGDFAFIDRLWAHWSPDYDASEDLLAIKEALAGPEHLATALGTYRCALGTSPTDPDLDSLRLATTQYPRIPHLYLHGTRDGCIGADVARRSQDSAPASTRFVMLEGAGHFMHLERPDQISQMIVEFLSEHTDAEATTVP